MKGQAFVGFPNEDAAAKALKHVHGYVLFDKPLIIVSFLYTDLLEVVLRFLWMYAFINELVEMRLHTFIFYILSLITTTPVSVPDHY